LSASDSMLEHDEMIITSKKIDNFFMDFFLQNNNFVVKFQYIGYINVILFYLQPMSTICYIRSN